MGAWFVRARVSLAMLGIELKTRSVKNLLFFEPTARRKTLPFLRRGVGLGPLDALRFASMRKSSRRIPVAISMSPYQVAADESIDDCPLT